MRGVRSLRSPWRRRPGPGRLPEAARGANRPRRLLAPGAAFPAAPPKFNKLAQNQPDLEHCAAQLEIMRLTLQALGSTQTEATGAYQGQFLFIDRRGVFTAQTYTGYQYPFMVRTGDGRLAVPGAIPMTPQQGPP